MSQNKDISDRLADFRTDKRMLLLSALAVPIGVISAGVAKALLCTGCDGVTLYTLSRSTLRSTTSGYTQSSSKL